MADTPRRASLVPKKSNTDRQYRPHPNSQMKKIYNMSESEEGLDAEERGKLYEFENDKISHLESKDVTESSSTESTDSSDHLESIECSNSSRSDSTEVYLRLRPIKNSEVPCSSYRISGNTITVPINDVNTTKTSLEKRFVFTDIFDDNFYQSDIYNNCVKQRIISEHNFTIMTYGTSGSGKTFTLLGGVESPGIIPRSLHHIFSLYSRNIVKTPTLAIKCGEIICLNDNQISECLLNRKILLGNSFDDVQPQYDQVKFKIFSDQKFVENHNNKVRDFSVSIWVSFVEIYNENCYDLLCTASETSQKRDNLKICSNNSNVYIKNLTLVFVKDSLEAYKLLTLGLKRVNYASTAVNLNSSRSHSIFMIDCLKSYRNGDVIHTTYKYCDLAGSERLAKTHNFGDRLKEAQHINTSLMVLGRCLDVAYQNQTKRNHDIIPFRDSKLTMILKGPLLGKEEIALLVNISPTEEYYEENLNVLRFSSIAKSIKIVAKKPEEMKQRFSILSNIVHPHATDDQYSAISEENISLKNEIEKFQNELRATKNACAKVILQMKKSAAKQEERLIAYYETKLQIKTEHYEHTTEAFESLIKQLQQKIEPHSTMDIIEDDDEDDDDDEDKDDEGDGEDNDDENIRDCNKGDDEDDKNCSDESLDHNARTIERNLNVENDKFSCSSQNSDTIESQNQTQEANSSNGFICLRKRKHKPNGLY